MSSPDSMMPVPSTNFGPSGGEGSSSGQGKVKAHIVSGMTVCMLSDCTTLPEQTHTAHHWPHRSLVNRPDREEPKTSTHSTMVTAVFSG